MNSAKAMLPPMPSRGNIGKKTPSALQNILNRDTNLFRVDSKPLSRHSITIANDEEGQQSSKRSIRLGSIKKPPVPRYRSSKRLSIDRPNSSDRPTSIQSRQSRQSRQSSAKLIQSSKNILNLSTSDVANMPYITAKSWVVYQVNSNTTLHHKKKQFRRQVASLTKISNLITILQMLQEHKLDPRKIKITVTKQAANMIGTTARLRAGMVFSLYDLFYAMMLPSGNDAAYQIAQFGGSLINFIREKQRSSSSGSLIAESIQKVVYNREKLREICENFSKVSITTYLNKMNTVAKFRAKTLSTSFANPHGLSNVNSMSTAQDMAKLSGYGLKNQTFRKVVQTKNYSCDYSQAIKVKNEKQDNENDENADPKLKTLEDQTLKQSQSQAKIVIQKKSISWENTNKMLWKGWSGVKTGITPHAGPCLSASVKRTINEKQYEFVIILLKSYSMDSRWKEVESLANFVSEMMIQKGITLS